MKKIYFEPQFELLRIESEQLLSGSTTQSIEIVNEEEDNIEGDVNMESGFDLW